MAINETVKIGKEYWYYRIPDNKPLNPSYWTCEQEPSSIIFNNVSRCKLMGINEESCGFHKIKIRIGYHDLYFSYDECLTAMIQHQEDLIIGYASSLEYQKEELVRLKELKKE